MNIDLFNLGNRMCSVELYLTSYNYKIDFFIFSYFLKKTYGIKFQTKIDP